MAQHRSNFKPLFVGYSILLRKLPSPRTSRIALVGDTHANAVWTGRVIEELVAEGVDMLLN